MAFLDNSGDIILDAVLTDLGRKRMAEGQFNIQSFALGDDEIDYRIYNKTHPSGSAYYDLEILQTPVLEAFASSNANVNYGLVSMGGNLNLLYMPTMKVFGSDKKVMPTGNQIMRPNGSVYLVAANLETATAVKSAMNTTHGSGNGTFYYMAKTNPTVIVVETGIDSPGANPPRTVDLSNKKRLINGKGLADSNFNVSVDSRFIQGVLSPAKINWSVETIGSVDIRIQSLSPYSPTVSATTIGIANYSTAIIPGHQTMIRETDDGTTASTFSTINGPSGQVAGVHVVPTAQLASNAAKYSLYGRTGQDLFSDGNTYDYIDTAVYVTGKTTGVTAHIPVRIVRKVV